MAGRTFTKVFYLLLLTLILPLCGEAATKEKIHALFVPLADHYAAAVVAHARYASQMQKCDYSVEMMQSWPSLRGKFQSGQADAAFIIGTLAMHMFAEQPNFRCVSLVHRDGNALALNEVFLKKVNLPPNRVDRKPTPDVAKAMADWKKDTGAPSVCGVPALESTHTVVLYKYLKDHGLKLAVGEGEGDVLAKAVAPPKSPEFLQQEAKGGRAASFEQSLPWADVVETGGFGKVAWYSKDIIKWPHGHVECIMIANNEAIARKREALKELVHYIHKAGQDIDQARAQGGQALEEIAVLINKYIPTHSVEAVKQSLSAELGVINYSNLSPEKAGIKHIMDLAVEGES